MSLPPAVKWRYDWNPDPDSPEEELYTKFLKPRQWDRIEMNASE